MCVQAISFGSVADCEQNLQLVNTLAIGVHVSDPVPLVVSMSHLSSMQQVVTGGIHEHNQAWCVPRLLKLRSNCGLRLRAHFHYHSAAPDDLPTVSASDE